MHRYQISGLRVSSEFVLPGAILEASPATECDVSICRGAVPPTLDGASASGPTWEMADDTFLLRVPRLARFQITAGRDIAVDVEPGVTEHDAAGFVLGTAFGILLHQRGALVLHGAAVAREGRAIAICGASGAGKSTLAAALCHEGHAFVADDICVVGLDSSQRPVALPDGRQLKLWQEAITRLDLADRQGEAVRETFEKYYIDPFASTAAKPPLLCAIYILREARPPLKAGIEALALPDAVASLDTQAYRPRLRARMGDRSEMLRQAAAMLGHTKVFMLTRPRDFARMGETVSSLRAHWDALDQ
jgi:energy-coupling factor transporter ATP-binding protein EcfA2